MVFSIKSQAWVPALLLLTISTQVAGQDECADSCSDYNSILVGCQSDSGPDYDSCVCNDPNFQSYVDECIACEGTDSDPYQFQQNCKSVPPDCTSACQGFSIILEDCGDTSDPGFGSCVCSGAYDETYSNTFNEDFQDCVTCENGGGQAADWEAYCCASTGNCNGMSPAASSEAATIQVSSTTTAPVSTTTQPVPVPTATSSGAAGDRAANTLGLGLGQLLLNGLIANF
jgi:hypothetical protein